jgi:HAD superfamily hydrolase (TIGR01549 family)
VAPPSPTRAFSGVDTVCLDAGGVLVWPNWQRVSGALLRQDVIVSPEALAAADPHARHALDVAEFVHRSSDQRRGWAYFDLILERAGIVPSERTARALEDLQAYHRALNLWEHVPAFVVPALAALRADGYRLALVSNANGTVRRAFERLGLASFLDAIVDSDEEGIEKPDPRLFRIALARVGTPPERAVHVGDLYHVDIVGARSAGLRALLVDQADLYSAVDCPRIRSVGALPALLARP